MSNSNILANYFKNLLSICVNFPSPNVCCAKSVTSGRRPWSVAILKHSIVLLEIPSPDPPEEAPQSWGSPLQHLIQLAVVWHHCTSTSIGPSKKRAPCSTMTPFYGWAHLELDLLVMSVTSVVIKCNFSLYPSFQCPHFSCGTNGTIFQRRQRCGLWRYFFPFEAHWQEGLLGCTQHQ